jgi:hypothetical protein
MMPACFFVRSFSTESAGFSAQMAPNHSADTSRLMLAEELAEICLILAEAFNADHLCHMVIAEI